MNGQLALKSVLQSEDGAKVRIEGMFGAGGQGEVYKVSVDGDPEPKALKWYYPAGATPQQRVILENLTARRIADTRFLWPRGMVTDPSGKSRGFGYLMDVRPDRFADLSALFRRHKSVRAVTMRSLMIVAVNTAEAFRYLHHQGIAYRDINWGNLFFDPASGDILICDNDNAAYEGTQTSILGTMEFIAPELVRRDGGVMPSTQTDLHALAVLLFMLTANHHPLQGAAAQKISIMTLESQTKLYGTHPVFIFDPSDNSNRPDPNEQGMVIGTWSATPPSLQRLFLRAFTQGLQDPIARVRENQWRDAFRAVHDSIVRCTSCGKENLVEPGPTPPATPCWKCRKTLVIPGRLEISAGMGQTRTVRLVRIEPGVKVYGFHLDPQPDVHDFHHVIGEIVAHPTQQGTLGLSNRTSRPWTVYQENTREQSTVPPGRSAVLREGLLIEFGNGAEAVFHTK